MVARLTVTAPPCDTCSHAPVCRIKEQVADLSRFTVVAPDDGPELDKALTVVASATVECAYYQRVGSAGTPKRVMSEAGLAAARANAATMRERLAAKRAEAGAA